LASAAIAERGLENWEAARGNLQEALNIYFTQGDRDMIARSSTELTALFVWAGRLQDAIETARRGLAYLEANVSADEARLLAVLAKTYAVAGGYEPAHEALGEALKIADRLSDPKLMAGLLGARSVINYYFLRLTETVADGEKSAGSEAAPWDRAIQLQVLYQTLLFLGRLQEAARIRDELEPFAAKIGQSYSIARCLITRAWLEFGQTPNLARLGTVIQQALNSDPKVPFWDVFSEVQLSLIDYLRGNWASALSHAKASFRPEGESSFRGIGVGTLFRQMAYTGDRGGAFAILHEKHACLPRSGRPNTMGSWWMLALVIEGLFILGEKSEAEQLYPLVRELVNTEAVVLWPIFRFTQTVAGIAAAAASQWQAAEDHFQTASRQAESIPHRLEQAEIRRFHAMMLIDRAAPGDREKAQTLLREALESYQRIGMPRHVDLTQTLLARVAEM
jgi:tetratricopeptide (TPR) repeat protein